MAIYLENDEKRPKISPPVDLGVQRFSLFEPRRDAKMLILFTSIVAPISGLVAYFLGNDPRTELYAFCAGLFAAILLVILAYGIITFISGRKQIHLFDLAIVETDSAGKVLTVIQFDEIEAGKIEHVPIHTGTFTIDEYSFRFSGGQEQLKFKAGINRSNAGDHADKVWAVVEFLLSRVPPSVERLGVLNRD